MPRQMRIQYPGAIYDVLSRGRCREDIYLIEGGLRRQHSGALHLEPPRLRAERIIAEELARLGWSEQDLAAHRKNAPEKLAIAARLRKETTLTIKEISARDFGVNP